MCRLRKRPPTNSRTPRNHGGSRPAGFCIRSSVPDGECRVASRNERSHMAECTGLLKDKVALITGASRGIGRSIAETFVREGARVVICGRNQVTLDGVAKEIGALVIPIACHVGRADDLQRMVEKATQCFGSIDVLVNNAGTNVAQGPCLE